MRNRKIYRKTLCFVWPRVPYCIAGGFALIWFPYLAIRITARSEGVFSNFLLVAMTAAGIFAAKFITSFGTKRAKAAHLAMMTRGVVYGVLPEDIKKEGYRVAKAHFEHITVGDISKRALGKAYVGILKKETDWKYAEDNGKKFLSELKTFAELSALNAVPYIGECALAWEYAYPGATLEESICDSLEVLKNSWIRFVFLLFAEIFLIVFYIGLTAVVAGTVVVLVLNAFPFVKAIADATIGAETGLSKFTVSGSDANILFLTYHVIVAALPFIRAKIRLMTLRCFFRAADRKPPVGKVYARLGSAINRLQSGIQKKKSH